MTVEAQRRSRLGEVVVVFDLAFLTYFVSDVASFATHVEGGMTAPLVGDVHALGMALQAEILAFVAGVSLDQLVLVIRLVGIVALDAIANRWRMDRALEVGSILVGVTSDTNRRRTGGDELDPRDIFIDANFMTAGAAHGNRRMNELAFGFVFVAFDTFGRVGVLVQRNRVNGRHHETRTER